ncbi:MAG TPA: Gldg family protein [Acidimicrobiia bacterium]|nr:Gldg family protein [Acidimicrobiia bacterium]
MIGATIAVIRRELRSLVSLPHTYAIACAFLAISGIFFVTFFVQSNLPDLEQYYSNIATTLLVLAPIIAMRSFAEERRAGALDITLSWPVPRTALVVGKYLVNLLYTWILLSIAWLYVRLLIGMGEMEVGKAVAGFVGILLLAAALSALALAVSARAASPTGAAFLGFGLLLGLWTLQFANRMLGPDIGRRIADISPANHLEAAARGVIDGGDVGYFLTCVVIGLGFAVHALERQRPGVTRTLGRRSGARLAAVGAVGVVLLVAGSSVEAQADLTPTKRFTITRQTKEIAERIHSPVHITGFVDPDGTGAIEMKALVRQYRTAHVPVDLEIVDPDAQPGRARAHGVSRYGQLLVRIGDRQELVPDVTEVALTSAILRLTRDKPAEACFTVGHGEPDIHDTRPTGFEVFAAYLRQLGYAPETLALGAPGGADRLARCAVVIAAPRIPLLPSELAMLQSYVQGNGRLIIMSDPDDATRAQLNELLRPFGMAIGAGAVRDRSALADDSTSVVAFSYPSESPPIRDLKREGIPVLFVAPHPIEKAISGEVQTLVPQTVVPLISSSSQSSVAGNSASGPFILAALYDASEVSEQAGTAQLTISRLAVVGSSAVASNRLIDNFGNRDFATGLVQWVGRETDVISAGRSFGGVRKIVLTRDRRDHLVRSAIVFPALALLIPMPVALLRLRRG